MSLQAEVMTSLKEAMKAKDTVALEALRAIKSALLLAQTSSGSKEEVSADQEMALLQKLVKQRKDSAILYKEQSREDLAAPELEQAKIIAQFLPEQMSEQAVSDAVQRVIAEIDAQGMKDMGKVMGVVNKELAGKADGKTIAAVVKEQLTA